MIRLRRILFPFVLFLTALPGCQSARPLSPLAPQYPSALANVGVVGNATVDVHVNRSGKVTTNLDTRVSGQEALFGAALKTALLNIAWKPAERFGRSRDQDIKYHADFVVLRDTVPSSSEEKVIEGNNTLPETCPKPRSNHHVVVCARPGRTRFKVLSQTWPNTR